MSNLVLIGRFFDNTQAHIARGILETNDIPCFIFDENHSSTAWHLSLAIGGTRLMVHKDDYEQAVELLKDFKEINAETAKKERPLIRKPYLKTFLGSIIGYIVGAPSIRPEKRKDKKNEV